MLINNFIFSEHSGFMHIAKFNCACLKTLKTGPAMAGLAGPTPTALYNYPTTVLYLPTSNSMVVIELLNLLIRPRKHNK